MTPENRTLAWLRAQGYAADSVERRIGPRIKKDWLGCWDIIAVGHGETVAVQVTDHSNFSKRLRKVSESEHIGTLREHGWRLLVVGWRKDRDEPRVEDVS